MTQGHEPQLSRMSRVDLMLRRDCNIRCAFCYQNIFDDGDDGDDFDFSFERITETLERGRTHNYEEVYISGGEPTLNDNLPEIISRARAIGFSRVKIMTNGLRLGSAAYCDTLADAGLTHVAFSLHGHTAEIHELHTRNPKSFDRLLSGLRYLIDLRPGVDCEVNTVVTRHNVAHLTELADLVTATGVRELHIQHVVPSSAEALALVPSPEEVHTHFRRAVDECPKDLHVSFAFVPYCWMRGYEEHVPRFDFTCEFLSNCDSMFDGWRDSLLAAKVTTEECNVCSDFDYCRGFWRRP